MAINAGADLVKDLYWGPNRVKRVHMGEELIFRAERAINSTSQMLQTRTASVTFDYELIDVNFYNNLVARLTYKPSSPDVTQVSLAVKIELRRDDPAQSSDSQGGKSSGTKVFTRPTTACLAETSIKSPGNFRPNDDGQVYVKVVGDVLCESDIPGVYGTVVLELFQTG